MDKHHWFEISHHGWQARARRRGLDRLLLEAVQNAFDVRASEVRVELEPHRVVIEDDAPQGFARGELVYTVFLSDKGEDPGMRGRLGRGLKELLASMESAVVETVGATLSFGPEGRLSAPNTRASGTRLELYRRFEDAELEAAKRAVKLCIPPEGTTLRIGGRSIRRPACMLALPSSELETVEVAAGIERAVSALTTVSLYEPRKGTRGHVFEMGIPIAPWNVPWHADVAQRVPLLDGRDGIPERFELQLKATLLEAMIHRYLDRGDLNAEWVHDAISRYPLEPSVLDAYVCRAFPRGAVLGGTRQANDRARQLGAHVIDAHAISHGTYVALARVVERADVYVRRRSAEFGGEDVAPDEAQRRFADAVRWLAREVAGRVIRVRFFARAPNDAGLLEDATTDPEARIVSFNVRGSLRFDDVLDPYTLGVVLHELAHLEVLEHDHRFIERLQFLAGQTGCLLARGGARLSEALRRGRPDEVTIDRGAG
jgi:hypothetical protein